LLTAVGAARAEYGEGYSTELNRTANAFDLSKSRKKNKIYKFNSYAHCSLHELTDILEAEYE